jgi:hypothetical protein
MANSAANVRVGAQGIIYHAPLLTALPTDTSTALNVAFVDVGYISEDGFSYTVDQASNDTRAWGGDLIRRITNEFGLTMTFTMVEHNANSVAAFYGNGSASAWEVKNVIVRKAWVAHITDGAKIRRIVVPDGEVTERGDVTFATADVVGYPITVTAYPNATGTYAFEYLT